MLELDRLGMECSPPFFLFDMSMDGISWLLYVMYGVLEIRVDQKKIGWKIIWFSYEIKWELPDWEWVFSFPKNNPINHENDLYDSTPSNQTDPSFCLLWVRMYENDYELYVIVCRSYKDG